jgi:GAF domain-containing protein
LIVRHAIENALHPKAFSCYFELDELRLAAAYGVEAAALETIPATLPALAALAARGRASLVPELDKDLGLGIFPALEPECLVPILGRDGHLVGVLILGSKPSREPYSATDMDLLDSVSSQIGIVVESLRLAEQIVQRMEAERRAQQEMELANQVQARLMPEKLPRLNTLDYAGRCVQARQVGGDYFDFLEMRPGRVAFVLADLGKGLPGALVHQGRT